MIKFKIKIEKRDNLFLCVEFIEFIEYDFKKMYFIFLLS